MADIPVTIDAPNETSIKIRFDEFDAAARKALIGPITNAGRRLFENARANAPHATGSLQNAVETHLAQGPDWIRVYVSVQPEHGEPFNIKAAALEYGAHARFEVAGYGRSIGEAFGQAIAPVEQVVSPYSRTPNIDEMRYLRNALTDDLQASLAADVEDALGDAAKEFNE